MSIDVSEAAHVVEAAAVLLGGVVAWFAFRETFKDVILSPKVTVLIDCNRRYDDLYAMSYKIRYPDTSITELEAAAFYEKYWSLLSDQFEYFISGLIDPITYSVWIATKIKRFAVADDSIAHNFNQGWEKYGRNHNLESPLFLSFVKKIQSEAKSIRENYGEGRIDSEAASKEMLTRACAICRLYFDSELVKLARKNYRQRHFARWNWGEVESIVSSAPDSIP